MTKISSCDLLSSLQKVHATVVPAQRSIDLFIKSHMYSRSGRKLVSTFITSMDSRHLETWTSSSFNLDSLDKFNTSFYQNEGTQVLLV